MRKEGEDKVADTVVAIVVSGKQPTNSQQKKKADDGEKLVAAADDDGKERFDVAVAVEEDGRASAVDRSGFVEEDEADFC